LFPIFARNADCVTVPERKEKHGEDTLLITVNRDITHGLVIFSYSLRQDRLKEHRNRYIQRGELFYFVPYREVLPICLPAADSRTLAELNLAHKRQAYEDCGRHNAGGALLRMKLLHHQPYGMTTVEWKSKIAAAERDFERGLFGGPQ
jgi:hypothetical protein